MEDRPPIPMVQLYERSEFGCLLLLTAALASLLVWAVGA